MSETGSIAGSQSSVRSSLKGWSAGNGFRGASARNDDVDSSTSSFNSSRALPGPLQLTADRRGQSTRSLDGRSGSLYDDRHDRLAPPASSPVLSGGASGPSGPVPGKSEEQLKKERIWWSENALVEVQKLELSIKQEMQKTTASLRDQFRRQLEIERNDSQLRDSSLERAVSRLHQELSELSGRVGGGQDAGQSVNMRLIEARLSAALSDERADRAQQIDGLREEILNLTRQTVEESMSHTMVVQNAGRPDLDLQELVSLIEAECTQRKAEVDGLRMELARERELRAADLKKAEADGSRADALRLDMRTVDELRLELSRERDARTGELREAEETWRSEAQRLAEEVANVQMSARVSQEMISSLEMDWRERKASLDQFQSKLANVDLLQSKVAAAGLEQLPAKLASIDHLHSKMAGMDGRLAAVDQLQSQLAGFEQLQGKLATFEQLHSKMAGFEQLQGQLASVEQLHRKMASVDMLQGKMASVDMLQGKLAVVEQLQSKMAAVDGKMATIDMLKSKVAAVEQQQSRLATSAEQPQGGRAQVNKGGDNETVRELAGFLQAECKARQVDVEEVRQKMAIIEARVMELSSVDSLQASVDECDIRVGNLAGSLDTERESRRSDYVRFEASLEALRSELNDEGKLRAADLEKLRRALADLAINVNSSMAEQPVESSGTGTSALRSDLTAALNRTSTELFAKMGGLGAELRQEMAARLDVSNTELRGDIAAVRAEMQVEVSNRLREVQEQLGGGFAMELRGGGALLEAGQPGMVTAGQIGEVLRLMQIITASSEVLAEKICGEASSRRAAEGRLEVRISLVERRLTGLFGADESLPAPEMEAPQSQLGSGSVAIPGSRADEPQRQQQLLLQSQLQAQSLISDDLKSSLEKLVSRVNRMLKPEEQASQRETSVGVGSLRETSVGVGSSPTSGRGIISRGHSPERQRSGYLHTGSVENSLASVPKSAAPTPTTSEAAARHPGNQIPAAISPPTLAAKMVPRRGTFTPSSASVSEQTKLMTKVHELAMENNQLRDELSTQQGGTSPQHRSAEGMTPSSLTASLTAPSALSKGRASPRTVAANPGATGLMRTAVPVARGTIGTQQPRPGQVAAMKKNFVPAAQRVPSSTR